MKLTLTFVFSALMSAQVYAKSKAAIYWGNINYENTMYLKSTDHVNGRLADLKVEGYGEDEEFVLACYKGAANDVCEVLKVAVSEENSRSKRSGKNKLELKQCQLNKDKSIIFFVTSENNETWRISSAVLGMSLIPECRR